MTAATKAKRTSKTRKRTGKTPEQREADARQLHDQLTAQIESLLEDGAWMRYLDFVRGFHSYSLSNLLLIQLQCPGASMVAGFRQWQAKGRQVRKGERAIKIRGFSSTKRTVDDEDATDEQATSKIVRVRYPILSVFDIAQTDPIEGAEDLTATANPTQRLTGEDEAGLYDRMAAYLTTQGWTVTREEIPGATNGFTTIDGTRRVVVDAALAPAQAAKTLLHEAAHATLHADENGHGDAADYVAHRGLRECEAESVAYVLAGMAGLDTAAYSVGYVATWVDGDLDAVRASADNVLKAVRTLAGAVLDQAEDDADAEVDASSADTEQPAA